MKKLIFTLYFLLAFQIFAVQNPKYKKIINLAEKLSYNFEFETCDSLINRAIELAPQYPEAYLLKAKIHLWYFLGSKDKDDYKLFFNFSDSAIQKTDELLELNKDNTQLIYLLGNIYKYRAMAYGSNGNTLDAFWSTKKSVSFYEDVIDLDSTIYSAYGGIGIFEYALSYVPALFNWALTISGLSADQNNGFSYIEKASTKGKLDKIEYTFHLSKLYDEHLADYDKSSSILADLISQFPNNSLFHYQAAIAYIKNRKLNKAIKELELVSKINNPKFLQTNSFSNFLLGDIYFRKKEYKTALEYYLTFLTTTKTIDYTGIASLRTAYCYYFLDNINEFKRYAIKASNGNLDLEDDKFAKEMGLHILGNGFSEERKILIEIENSYLAGNNKESLQIINNNLDSLETDNIIAQAKLYKSSILLENKKLAEAEISLNGMDSLDLRSAEWVQPMYLLNIAKIKYLKGKYKMAKEYLELAEIKNDYQNKNLIKSQINGFKRKLIKVK